MLIPLQLESAISSFLNYGIVGALLIVVGFFAWHLYKIQEENSREWKFEAKASNKQFVELASKQNDIAEKQLELQKQGNIQTKEYYDSMDSKMDTLPAKIMKEIQYQKLVEAQNNNTTSA